jgi:hypothetical protein
MTADGIEREFAEAAGGSALRCWGSEAARSAWAAAAIQDRGAGEDEDAGPCEGCFVALLIVRRTGRAGGCAVEGIDRQAGGDGARRARRSGGDGGSPRGSR